MTQSRSTLSPPHVAKQSLISQHLRNGILQGKLAPGGRLPTQIQLVEQFRVSGVTIQRVMNKLIREGFICTHGRSGTFVSTHPPHLFNYAMVFHDKTTLGKHRSRYHELLETEALRMQRQGNRRITIYSGISGHDDTEASRQLLSKVRSHQLAGLLLIDGDVFSHTPLVAEPGIFRTAIMSCEGASVRCPYLYPDMNGMIDLALDILVARGRRRVATLCTAPVYRCVGSYLQQAMQARGMSVYDRWMQIIPHEIPQAVRNNVELMMADSREHPDGIFIVDDNLIEGAVTGLLKAGVGTSPGVEVVAHCNFPWISPFGIPIHRIGFDTAQIVENAIRMIDLQRQGERVPSVTKVLAVSQVA